MNYPSIQNFRKSSIKTVLNFYNGNKLAKIENPMTIYHGEIEKKIKPGMCRCIKFCHYNITCTNV